MRHATPFVGAAATVAVAATLALPAQAKEGVRATLLSPVDMRADAGTTVRVRWKLTSADGRRFGASGIYLRVSRCGRRPLRIRAAGDGTRGPFSARVKVPAGGIRKLMVGLEGWRTYPGGRSERADALFAFDPPLAGRRCR